VETLLSQVQELQQLHQLVVAPEVHTITKLVQLEDQEEAVLVQAGLDQELQIKVMLAEHPRVVVHIQVLEEAVLPQPE
jgi:hypothetical protein